MKLKVQGQTFECDEAEAGLGLLGSIWWQVPHFLAVAH